jgi:hypothetical protein
VSTFVASIVAYLLIGGLVAHAMISLAEDHGRLDDVEFADALSAFTGMAVWWPVVVVRLIAGRMGEDGDDDEGN